MPNASAEGGEKKSRVTLHLASGASFAGYIEEVVQHAAVSLWVGPKVRHGVRLNSGEAGRAIIDLDSIIAVQRVIDPKVD